MCNHTNGICDAGEVCMGYNVGGALRGFCTPVIVGSTLGEQAACAAAGWDDACQTGLCASTSPTTRFCAFPCVNATHCATVTGAPKCVQVTAPATLEGVSITMNKVCTPP
jgi:hypothetical protein